MAGRRRLERKTDDRRPVVTDDFIYDDPQQSFSDSESDPVSSDTPEEAVRKLRKRTSQNDNELEENDSRSDAAPEEKAASERDTVYSSGIRLDENLQPVYESGKKARKPHPFPCSWRLPRLFSIVYTKILPILICLKTPFPLLFRLSSLFSPG